MPTIVTPYIVSSKSWPRNKEHQSKMSEGTAHPVPQLREDAVVEDGAVVRRRPRRQQVLQRGAPKSRLRRLLPVRTILLQCSSIRFTMPLRLRSGHKPLCQVTACKRPPAHASSFSAGKTQKAGAAPFALSDVDSGGHHHRGVGMSPASLRHLTKPIRMYRDA